MRIIKNITRVQFQVQSWELTQLQQGIVTNNTFLKVCSEKKKKCVLKLNVLYL